MILIACALSLLVVYAGMKLLALTKKDTLGNGYKAISWVLIIMGFLLLLCGIAHGVMHHRCNKMMMQNEMRDGGWRNSRMGGMYCHHDGMMGGGCYGSMKDGCGDGMKDGGMCGDRMGSCDGNVKNNSCNMSDDMKGKTNMQDSMIIKKK